MKSKKTFLLSFIILLLCENIAAQNSLVGFPTPEAAELGKYGQIPVSYFNGLPEISIPIYTVQCKNLQVPISLTYHAGGNKPDDHPSWVGLGWNLNAGGMITRTINGLRDEVRKEDMREYTTLGLFSELGYYYRANDINMNDSILLNKMVSTDYSYWFLDTQPDEFIFNFCGYSGSFYFVNTDGKINVKVKSKSGDILKVEPVFFENEIDIPVLVNSVGSFDLQNNHCKVFKTFSKFVVTTIDGNKYEFGGSVDNIDFTMSTSIRAVASSWHLTKIISSNGDFINFEYAKGGTNFVQKKAKYYYTSWTDAGVECCIEKKISGDGLSFIAICPRYLKKIETSTNQVVNFITSRSTELDYDNWDMIHDYNTDIINSFFCKYGWTKDRLNDNYFLKLDRIEIQNVKNINLFYSNSTAQRLKLLGVSLSPNKSFPSDLNDPLNINRYVFSYNAKSLPKYNSRLTDNWGYYNNKDYSSIPVNEYSRLYDVRMPNNDNLNYEKAEILERITYPTGGASAFDYELNTYSKIVSRLDTVGNNFTIYASPEGYAGGLRIKKIINYPDINDLTRKTEKTFFYQNSDGISSSGVLSGIPLYSTGGKEHIEYKVSGWSGVTHSSSSANFDLYYNLYSENALLPLSNTNGNHVTYSRVKVQESDGSYTVYSYTNHDDFPDQFPSSVITNMYGRLIIDAFTSIELERGLLKSEEKYSKDGILVNKTEFRYNDDANRYGDYVKTVDRYKLDGGICCGDFIRYSSNKIYTFFPYLKTKIDIQYDSKGNNPIINTTNYMYNKNSLIQNVTTLNSKNEILKSQTKYSGDDFLTASVYNEMKTKNILNYPIEKMSFKNNQVIGSELFTYKSILGFSNSTLYVLDKKYKMDLISPISGYSEFNGSNMDAHYTQPESYVSNYDSRGNITQVTDRSGMSITYLWGYNYQYPIAEIKNRTYDQVKSGLSFDPETFAADAVPDPAKINTIRSSFSDAIVTTYTYRPFVGIASVTSPVGITTYYDYDSIGRLIEQYILYNGKKKILRIYSYNYKK